MNTQNKLGERHKNAKPCNSFLYVTNAEPSVKEIVVLRKESSDCHGLVSTFVASKHDMAYFIIYSYVYRILRKNGISVIKS